MPSRYAMIMAGGSGTRLWPLSRRARPKQLLPLIGGRSLLELAFSRLQGLIPPRQRLVCTADRFRSTILDALPELDDARILGEPVGRDTVNAVGLTAAVLARHDEQAVFAVLTADHLIEPLDEFRRKMAVGFELVEADPRRLVTFSIRPTYAAASYGYVERGDRIEGQDDAFRAARFVEKPDAATAQRFLDAGTFGWNSGMFVFAARTFLDALERYLPEAHAGLTRIAEAWETDDRRRVLEEIYPTLPKISVDYAVMEPAARDRALEVCIVEMNVSWMDVGSWLSYARTVEADAQGNRSTGHAVHLASRNVLAVSDDPGHTIATIGCEDLIVIHTADATLVCSAAEAERVKDIVGHVDESLR